MIEEDKVRKILAGLMIFIVSMVTALGLLRVRPLDTVKANVNVVLDVLKDPNLKGESGKRSKNRRSRPPPTSSLITSSFPKGLWA